MEPGVIITLSELLLAGRGHPGQLQQLTGEGVGHAAQLLHLRVDRPHPLVLLRLGGAEQPHDHAGLGVPVPHHHLAAHHAQASLDVLQLVHLERVVAPVDHVPHPHLVHADMGGIEDLWAVGLDCVWAGSAEDDGLLEEEEMGRDGFCASSAPPSRFQAEALEGSRLDRSMAKQLTLSREVKRAVLHGADPHHRVGVRGRLEDCLEGQGEVVGGLVQTQLGAGL